VLQLPEAYTDSIHYTNNAMEEPHPLIPAICYFYYKDERAVLLEKSIFVPWLLEYGRKCDCLVTEDLK
jgi:hypothetical protein